MIEQQDLSIPSAADPVTGVLDALAAHVHAAHWVLVWRDRSKWSFYGRRPLHWDDLLGRLLDELPPAPGMRHLETTDLGDPGRRLHSSGVATLVAIGASPEEEEAVVILVDPDRDRAGALVRGELGAKLGGFASAAWELHRAGARARELKALRRWVPLMDLMTRGEKDELDVLRSIAEIAGGRCLVAIRPERDGAQLFCVSLDELGTWQRSTRRMEGPVAMTRPPTAAELDAAVAPLGVEPSDDWCVGTAYGEQMTLAVGGGGAYSADGIDVFATLFALGMTRGRDAAVIRNNALLQERARIASVMHEGITQVLTNVAIQMEVMDGVVDDPEAARKMLRSMRTAVLDALDDLRGAILELTPAAPEWTDLAGGLERFVGDFASQWGLQITYAVEGSVREADPEALALIFGFVQEALSNVRKHAGTAEAEVALVFEPGHLRLSVADAGKGFEPAEQAEDSFRQHQGIAIMRSRVRLAGGTMGVESKPGEGTVMWVELTG
ncbi:MAG: sensor histidine kinase [Actinomycetota bacterium]